MPTYYRIDPNQNQLPQFYVIDTDASLANLKTNNNGSCQGNLQNLNHPQFVENQIYYCNTGGNINTAIYSTNP